MDWRSCVCVPEKQMMSRLLPVFVLDTGFVFLRLWRVLTSIAGDVIAAGAIVGSLKKRLLETEDRVIDDSWCLNVMLYDDAVRIVYSVVVGPEPLYENPTSKTLAASMMPPTPLSTLRHTQTPLSRSIARGPNPSPARPRILYISTLV